jgi:hypothetical protein
MHVILDLLSFRLFLVRHQCYRVRALPIIHGLLRCHYNPVKNPFFSVSLKLNVVY